MRLNPELFIIPVEETFIVYAPLSGSIANVGNGIVRILQDLEINNKHLELDSEVLKFLKEKHFIITEREFEEYTKLKTSNTKEYCPTGLTILPTFDCNLKCVYCYSKGGENATSIIPIDSSKAAIDFIINNALNNRENEIQVGFHGGGEPFHHKSNDTIIEIVEYYEKQISKYKIRGRLTGATNGVIDMEYLKWITNHFDYLTISLDGPEDIQNVQRPTKNNTETYNRVITSINYLNKKQFPHSFRTTITNYEKIIKR